MKLSIGDRIRQLRVVRNLSQENIANELDISVAAYSNIERGVTEITVARLEQIAELFEVSILHFFSENTEAKELQPPFSPNSEIKVLQSQMAEMQKLHEKLLQEFTKLKTQSSKKSRK
jgi:transcriptional regulator with XRE-family HTH domain